MRVFVVSDMEGVSGIVKWEQVSGGESLYEEGRKLYTEEINAAVRGAKAAGATEIVVMDCHGAGKGWDFNSLVPELLDPDCEWVVQNEWTEYTEILEQGCDAALFIGMHAKAGTPLGVMSHTISGRDYRDLRFNGTSVGETGVNAALCGTWDCPVVLVTGDDVVCREAADLLGPELVTVEVKQALGRYSARNLPPVRARELIEAGAKEAVEKRDRIPPYDPGKPCEIEAVFADRASSSATSTVTASRSTASRSSRGPTTGGRPGASSSSSPVREGDRRGRPHGPAHGSVLPSHAQPVRIGAVDPPRRRGRSGAIAWSTASGRSPSRGRRPTPGVPPTALSIDGTLPVSGIGPRSVTNAAVAGRRDAQQVRRRVAAERPPASPISSTTVSVARLDDDDLVRRPVGDPQVAARAS